MQPGEQLAQGFTAHPEGWAGAAGSERRRSCRLCAHPRAQPGPTHEEVHQAGWPRARAHLEGWAGEAGSGRCRPGRREGWAGAGGSERCRPGRRGGWAGAGGSVQCRPGRQEGWEAAAAGSGRSLRTGTARVSTPAVAAQAAGLHT